MHPHRDESFDSGCIPGYIKEIKATSGSLFIELEGGGPRAGSPLGHTVLRADLRQLRAGACILAGLGAVSVVLP